MPSDLIYREDAKDYARHAMAKGRSVLEYLDKVPAAGFRPAVRGEWMHTKITADLHEIGQCSVCKEIRRIDNFCPNCGAIMEEADGA